MRRGLITLAAVAGALALAPLANATPIPVHAFYVYGSSVRSLQHAAYYDAKRYAGQQPAGTNRVLMLDFGAARKIDSDTWGVLGFAGVRFANGEVLQALESAADGYHDGHSSGETMITYGNSNYHLARAGMSSGDAWYAGYYQSYRAKQLAGY